MIEVGKGVRVDGGGHRIVARSARVENPGQLEDDLIT